MYKNCEIPETNIGNQQYLKKWQQISFGEGVEKKEPYAPVLEIWVGTATMENILQVPQKKLSRVGIKVTVV